MEPNETAVAEYKPMVSTLVEQAKAIKVKTFENAMDVADFLYEVKQMAERITAKKEEITKPANAALKAARALFKPMEEQCAEAEAIAKEAVLTYHQKQWDKEKHTDNTIHGLRGKVTVIERIQVRITDEAAIPQQFCSPDAAKIEHALKAGITVPGAELIKSYGLAAGKI